MDLYLILFFVSLGINLILFFIVLHLNRRLKKKRDITLKQALYILVTVIDNHKNLYFKSLKALSKKHSILQSDGSTIPPNDTVLNYAQSKKKLKIAIMKKIIRSFSKEIRETFLIYYSEKGFINYIMTELDKDE